MRIVLLQDEIYLPSFAGGTKANRCLIEGFAKHGHQCLALTRALTSSPDGPNDQPQFLKEMGSRRITVRADQPDVLSYESQGVEVEAINCPSVDARRDYVTRRLQAFEPDWVFVADDKRRFMLASASAAAPGRVVPLLQTIMQLPFGPLAVDESQTQTNLMREAPAIIVISKNMQNYIRVHGEMESHVMRMPVYGAGPFPNLARSDAGFVTMINPCELKGVAIFLALARLYPQVSFAAVPTWGADEGVLRDLNALPNVRLLEPSDNVEDILAQTRILVVPSLWPETFGYVVPEAMLRGIPVLASDLGGLPEAKLGVDYLLPVTPAQRRSGTYVSPLQDTEPWSQALAELLGDAAVYERCSRRSRQAALEFVSSISVAPFEMLMSQLARLEKNGHSTKQHSKPPAPGAEEPVSSKTVVAIVDPYSSGTQLAREVEARGHTCLMVQSQEEVPALYRSSFHAEDFDSISRYHGNLEETIAELKARNVGCVIAGCESGVELSDQLSERLGLVSNGTRLTQARRNKLVMGETLRQKGVRTPAALSSRELGEVLDWVRARGSQPVVLKPLCSSASDGVCLCTNEAEIQIAFQDIIGRSDVYGLVNEAVLVQEYLTGSEFAVDTVSYAGRHKVTAIWEYGKLDNGGSFFGNDSLELRQYSQSLNRRLFPYVASVLDALEIKYGPAHCELFLSDDGPVIIEIGARLNGGNNPLLSRYCGGDSQFDMTLDAYLDPTRFLDQLDEPYVLSKCAMRVFLIPRQNGRLKSLPRFDPIKRLDSFHELRFSAKPGCRLSRIAGWVLLVHEDRAVIHRDLQQIRRLEMNELFQIEPDVLS